MRKHRMGLNFSVRALVLVLLATLVTACLESCLLLNYFGAKDGNIYISTIFSAVAALLLADSGLPFLQSRFIRGLGQLGRSYSTGFYIMHYMVFIALEFAERYLKLRLPVLFDGRGLVSPLSVALVTMGILWVYHGAKALFSKIKAA